MTDVSLDEFRHEANAPQTPEEGKRKEERVPGPWNGMELAGSGEANGMCLSLLYI